MIILLLILWFDVAAKTNITLINICEHFMTVLNEHFSIIFHFSRTHKKEPNMFIKNQKHLWKFVKYLFSFFSPNSSGAEWGSQFFQETGFVPSSFPGSGQGSGLVSLLLWASVSSSFAGFFWFRVGFRGLSPYSYGFLFHRHLLVSSGSG